MKYLCPRDFRRGEMEENMILPYHFSDEQIYSVADTRLGLYRQTGMRVVNFLLNPEVLSIGKEDRPGLVNPLTYYLR